MDAAADDDDLFADSDSDDTAELIASSGKNKKEGVAKKQAKDSDDEGLFDSDDDDDDEQQQQQQDKKKKKEEQVPKKKELSKRERLEALAKKKKDETKVPSDKKQKKKKSKEKKDSAAKKDSSGYDSEDTYDSGTFVRTKEDDDFIDTTGEDAEDIRELYAEQNFDDERPDDMGAGKKKGKKRRFRHDEAEEARDGEPDNPIMAAVHRMKKKKREKKSFSEQEEEAKTFLGKMELAAEEDEQAIAERRPGMKKLAMLNEVIDMLARRDMQRMLLDFDLLTVCKRWIQPLPNGGLGNVTIRQRLLEAIATMNGENGITANDLKRSELGKVVMILYKHHSETPAMKQKHKALIEQWSRPIFQKSGNMRDLERVHAHRGGSGLSAVARRQQFADRSGGSKSASGEQQQQDLNSLIASGKKGNTESGINRVRVPFSKGFAFSVRPTSRAGDIPTEKRGGGAVAKDNRGKLSKRMVEKSRAVSKNQRSANISIEGRQTKG